MTSFGFVALFDLFLRQKKLLGDLVIGILRSTLIFYSPNN